MLKNSFIVLSSSFSWCLQKLSVFNFWQFYMIRLGFIFKFFTSCSNLFLCALNCINRSVCFFPKFAFLFLIDLFIYYLFLIFKITKSFEVLYVSPSILLATVHRSSCFRFHFFHFFSDLSSLFCSPSSFSLI